MRSLLFVPLLILLLLPHAALAGSCAATVALPLKDGPDGTVMVRGNIGKAPVSLMIDTGAARGVLREAVVDTLRLPRRQVPLNSAAIGIGGDSFREVTEVDRLEFGKLAFDRLDMMIAPRSHAPDQAMDGLLGGDVLARFDLDLDFAARVARLSPSSACPPPSGWVAVPLTVLPSGHIRVKVAIDGRPVMALLDTGASHSTMNLDAAHDLFGIASSSSDLRLVGSETGVEGVMVDAYRYPFRSLTIGGVTLANPPILLIANATRRMHVITPNGGDRTAWGPEGFPDFFLGIAELKRFHLIIAYRDAKLYLAPTEGLHPSGP